MDMLLTIILFLKRQRIIHDQNYLDPILLYTEMVSRYSQISPYTAVETPFFQIMINTKYHPFIGHMLTGIFLSNYVMLRLLATVRAQEVHFS